MADVQDYSRANTQTPLYSDIDDAERRRNIGLRRAAVAPLTDRGTSTDERPRLGPGTSTGLRASPDDAYAPAATPRDFYAGASARPRLGLDRSAGATSSAVAGNTSLDDSPAMRLGGPGISRESSGLRAPNARLGDNRGTPGTFGTPTESRPQVPAVQSASSDMGTSSMFGTTSREPAPMFGTNLDDRSLATSRQRNGIPTEASTDIANVLTPPRAGSPTLRPSLDPSGLRAAPDARYNAMLEEGSGVSRKHGVGGAILKGLDVAGSVLAPRAMAMIPGTTLNFRSGLQRERKQEDEDLQQQRRLGEIGEQEARIPLTLAQTREANARADYLENPEPDNPLDKKIDEYTNDQGQRVLTFQTPAGKTYDRVGGRVQEKTTGHTSPFEAFAYGTPEEKRAAQDFLALEKRLGAKYQRPDEIERRYELFKKDPDSYRAMFGDRGQAADDRKANADCTHASRMLNFFQKQRDRISSPMNFEMGEDEKAKALQEIDEMEKPFMDTARGNGEGASGDRVSVVSPDGTPGTIPRSQLGAAKKKGYKVAGQPWETLPENRLAV